MRTAVRALSLSMLFSLALALPLGAACPSANGPAATLLFPYFEVDLDGSRTTLLAVGHTDYFQRRTLVRVTVWTDWGIPTFSFDVYLAPRGALQTINLRDLFLFGTVPVTRPPAGAFPGCAATLGGAIAQASALRNQHTGRASLGYCFSNPRSDTSLATGYVTVDVVRRCAPPIMNAARPGYFTGSDPVALSWNGTPSAGDPNRLFGDFLLVDPAQNYASGHPAVAVPYDAAAFEPGDYTFYGRYLGFSAADDRRPLPRLWNARFVTGGGFDGGTDLLVWRDNRSASISPLPCANRPTWVPLGEMGVSANGEDGSYHSLGTRTTFFDLATQRVDVAAELHPPVDFGWLGLDLTQRNGTRGQAWVGGVASADGRFGANLAAIPRIVDPCSQRP